MSKEYIEKEAAQLYAENIREYLSDLHNDGWITITDIDWRVLMSLILAVNDIPPADVKPVVRGKWLDGRCTNCAWELPDYEYYGGSEIGNVSCDEFKFCPNCGADMGGGKG